MPPRPLKAWSGNVLTASGWIQAKNYPVMGPVQTAFVALQDTLQAHFQNQLALVADAGTRRVLSKLLGRCGKLYWAGAMSDPASAARFAPWHGTTRRDLSESMLAINCWEAILYGAYQADRISTIQCAHLYQLHYNPADPTANIRALFGTAALYAPGVSHPGDILTWTAGVATTGQPIIKHEALYAGSHQGTHYALQQTAWLPSPAMLRVDSSISSLWPR